jgi:hypothetical protein
MQCSMQRFYQAAAFRDHPDWTRLKSMEEYQNNVSHIDIVMLHHTAYSDF